MAAAWGAPQPAGLRKWRWSFFSGEGPVAEEQCPATCWSLGAEGGPFSRGLLAQPPTLGERQASGGACSGATLCVFPWLFGIYRVLGARTQELISLLEACQ